ncbi:MAG: hypothetical protein LUG60_00770 [Erysipelotrichaceae bacterium]|nr:hypothetical protein [Erysipelotrichaceae bacterium]
MNKKEYNAFIQNKKEMMHYDEMSDEDKLKFDEDNEQIEYTDSKHEEDYINEEDLKIDDAL